MNDIMKTLLVLCPLVFLGGFIDAIAGGGGLISLPAYIFVGLPPHFALGTNKFSGSCGTLFSTLRFMKNKHVHLHSAGVSVVGALIGSALGAMGALYLEERYLRYFLVVALPVIAVFILTRKRFGETETIHNLSVKKITFLSFISGMLIGGYDGFFGPGAGTFLILVYTTVLGFTLTTASGNAKVVNLASNIAALITFMLSGKVLLTVGIPAAIFGILGNWMGAGLAIKNGAKVIKPMFIVVLVLLFIKIAIDLF